MAAGWLAAFTWRLLHGHRGIGCLVTPVLVVLVKRVDWPAGLCLMLLGLAATAIALLIVEYRGNCHPAGRWRFAAIAVVWLAWLALACDWHRGGHANHVVSPLDRRPIVCLGDSLTSMGAEGGYPEVLATMLAVPVMNLGQPGLPHASYFCTTSSQRCWARRINSIVSRTAPRPPGSVVT